MNIQQNDHLSRKYVMYLLGRYLHGKHILLNSIPYKIKPLNPLRERISCLEIIFQFCWIGSVSQPNRALPNQGTGGVITLMDRKTTK